MVISLCCEFTVKFVYSLPKVVLIIKLVLLLDKLDLFFSSVNVCLFFALNCSLAEPLYKAVVYIKMTF